MPRRSSGLWCLETCLGAGERGAGKLDAERAELIERAAREVIDGTLKDEFPLRIWQTGRAPRPT